MGDLKNKKEAGCACACVRACAHVHVCAYVCMHACLQARKVPLDKWQTHETKHFADCIFFDLLHLPPFLHPLLFGNFTLKDHPSPLF